MYAILGEEK